MEVYMLFRFRVVSYLVLSVLCISGSAYGQAELFKGLNDYILKSMRDWETPGLALAVDLRQGLRCPEER